MGRVRRRDYFVLRSKKRYFSVFEQIILFLLLKENRTLHDGSKNMDRTSKGPKSEVARVKSNTSEYIGNAIVLNINGIKSFFPTLVGLGAKSHERNTNLAVSN